MASVPSAAFDPGSQEFAWHAYERYAELRDASPVHRLLQPDGTEVWLVTRYDDARAALADPRLSKDGHLVEPALKAFEQDPAAAADDPWIPLDMLSRDGLEHGRLRRLVSRAFTPRRTQELRPLIEDLTERLLDGMAPAVEIDLLDAFAFPLPITVICGLVGVATADQERIRHLSEMVFTTDRTEGSGEGVTEADAYRAFNQYLSDLVQNTAPLVRRELPEDEQPGLLHALIVAGEHDDQLSYDEIIDTLRLLLAAGFETTANLIGNGMLALFRHPEQRQALVDHPELLPNAVEELLRYDGPAERATWRISTEHMTIGGADVPAHSLVGVVLAAANHDPAQFPDPERLDVSRACPHHLGFGHGAHFCLGAPLARMEAQIGLARLLARFPDLELACPVENLRFRSAGYLIRGLHRLPVRLHGASAQGG